MKVYCIRVKGGTIERIQGERIERFVDLVQVYDSSGTCVGEVFDVKSWWTEDGS